MGVGTLCQPTNKSAYEQHGSPSESWVTQICGLKINQVTKQSNKIESENGNVIYWLLDSGCTDHIVKSDNYFEKFTILKNPVNVKLPDGKLLKATKIGNMKIKVKNYYSEKQIVLSNVYYVEGIKQNLLSPSTVYNILLFTSQYIAIIISLVESLLFELPTTILFNSSNIPSDKFLIFVCNRAFNVASD